MSSIFFHFEEIPELELPEQQLSESLEKIASVENQSIGDLNYIFCSDDYLLEINKRFLDHDYYTDVITFNYNTDEISGDIYISLTRVEENARLLSVPFDRELCRIMAHGLLHLLGYNDKEEFEKVEMKKKEEASLTLFPEFDVPRGTFPS